MFIEVNDKDSKTNLEYISVSLLAMGRHFLFLESEQMK
jgi:hypothetical protein